MRREHVITSAQLFGAASRLNGSGARGIDLVGTEITDTIDAIALSPFSDIPRAMAYFDGDTIGELLLPGRVIARSAKLIRLAPIMPVSLCAGTLAAAFTPRAPLAPGVLRIDTWSGEVPLTQPTLRTSCVDQLPVVANGFSDEDLLAVFQVAGAKAIRVWASNSNTANAGGTTAVKLHAMRPQVPAGSDPRTAGGGVPIALGATLATLTVPQAADNDFRVESVVVEPGAVEVAITITPPTNNDDCSIVAGLEITWS